MCVQGEPSMSKLFRICQKLSLTFCALLLSNTAIANKTVKYSSKIPEHILMPRQIVTKIGTLEFFDGIPNSKTTQILFDNLDLSRGLQTVLNGIPAANFEAARVGHLKMGQIKANQVIIFDELMDSNSLFLTGNTGTVYLSSFFNLKSDGPIVIEIPPGTGPGILIDAFSRNIIDMGPPGPHHGKGGKFLILPPGFNEKSVEKYVSKGTFTIAKSQGYMVWLLLRGFLKKGKPEYSSELFRDGVKIYPLKDSFNPPTMDFINGSGKHFNTIHASNFEFYEELHRVLDREPLSFIDPELRGLFSSIGIEKGKPFSPDQRMKKILSQAALLGNATIRALFWYERDKSEFLYNDRHWKRGMIGNSYEYLKTHGLGGRNLDARAQYFYMATFNSPAMVWKLIGRGSQYAWGYLDLKGHYLDGGKSYKLTLPGNVPAKKFMSIVVYDSQTRSMLQTGQHFPSKNNKRDKLIRNPDNSITIYFGPTAPTGKESNWIQTIPNKGWFTLLRLYSPTEAWFDKSWRPGEIIETSHF